jgi:hypothetical protein
LFGAKPVAGLSHALDSPDAHGGLRS